MKYIKNPFVITSITGALLLSIGSLIGFAGKADDLGTFMESLANTVVDEYSERAILAAIAGVIGLIGILAAVFLNIRYIAALSVLAGGGILAVMLFAWFPDLTTEGADEFISISIGFWIAIVGALAQTAGSLAYIIMPELMVGSVRSEKTSGSATNDNNSTV
jgi:hypothetical protein